MADFKISVLLADIKRQCEANRTSISYGTDTLIIVCSSKLQQRFSSSANRRWPCSAEKGECTD